MSTIPKKVEERLAGCLKRFQTVLINAKAKDVNESDTVIIITDMLAELFGYDKYSDISSEHSIRGTFCDLAVSIEGKVQLLVEIKAIGLDLKDNHVKQVVDYAANKGVDWVILTNAINWRMYKVSFSKPIDQELVLEIDFLKLTMKNEDDAGSLYLLTKEGWQKQVMVDFAAQKEVLNKFFIAGMMLSDPVLDTIRRELKKAWPDVRVKNEQIQAVLFQEVLKREVVEGEKADDARRKILRANSRLARVHDTKDDNSDSLTPAPTCVENIVTEPPQPTAPPAA